MTTKIGINGFGRIGRMVFRRAIQDPDIEIVAMNASYPPETLAHLLKYDSIHGRLNNSIEVNGNQIIVDDKPTIVLSDRNPLKLPWGDLGVEIVVEATGSLKIVKATASISKVARKRLSSPHRVKTKT